MGLDFEAGALALFPSVEAADGVDIGDDNCVVELVEVGFVDTADVEAARFELSFEEVGVDAVAHCDLHLSCLAVADDDVV